ncbi:hypothetical protein SDC9_201329 [bioreactor metagenome]|uniref:Uncharacterized protein n=1 Tax=bioreactor metagenome TaxID=1076179 RepID=A0A645IQL6_9ZZZZ
MTGQHHSQVRARQSLFQVVGRRRRAAHVVASLDDGGGNCGKPAGITNQLTLGHEAVVDEVVVLDPGERQGVVRVGELRDVRIIEDQ